LETSPNVPNHCTAPVVKQWRCWRPECRDRFGDYRTLRLSGGVLVAMCHKAEYPLTFDLRVEIWRFWA
jgi:hypothetical protein